MIGVILGLLASILTLVSMYLLGEKLKSGFILSLVSQVVWFARGLEDGLIDLLIIPIVFAIIAIWNYHKWNRAEQQSLAAAIGAEKTLRERRECTSTPTLALHTISTANLPNKERSRGTTTCSVRNLNHSITSEARSAILARSKGTNDLTQGVPKRGPNAGNRHPVFRHGLRTWQESQTEGSEEAPPMVQEPLET